MSRKITNGDRQGREEAEAVQAGRVEVDADADADVDDDANAEGQEDREEAEGRQGRAEAEVLVGLAEEEGRRDLVEVAQGEEGRPDTLLMPFLPACSLAH